MRNIKDVYFVKRMCRSLCKRMLYSDWFEELDDDNEKNGKRINLGKENILRKLLERKIIEKEKEG